MELTIHNQVLLIVFITAVVMGGVVNKTNFCTMGAVSDWVNMGDKGRLRAWIFAMAIAMLGVAILEATGALTLPGDTFPPYRTSNFAWLRYVLGGLMFGIGMTLGSGCGNKTLIRIGGGNIKSVVVLIIASIMAYMMLWTDMFNIVFNSWMAPTTIDLAERGMNGQGLGSIIGGLSGLEDSKTLQSVLGVLLAIALIVYVFRNEEFRNSLDHVLAGVVVGLAVLIGWYVTGGSMGTAWKEYADFAPEIPSRVAVQSYTFISPMGDTVRYLMSPAKLSLINFGVVALFGVIIGSFLYAIFSKSFRVEWFVNKSDFFNHAVGGVLMGVGGVLSMGCTVGQAITGVSTLALGSFLTFGAIVFGCALTMKVQFNMMDEQGFVQALRNALAEMRLLPKAK